MKFIKASALMAVLLTCAVLLFGVATMRTLPPARGTVTPAGNGDVNCDGSIDITDAIYLLQSIFLGGDEPCALAQENNFASKDDLNALAARVAALEASNKTVATVATGNYIGDGVLPRTIQTGLSGKLRYLTVQADNYGVMGATDQRTDANVSFNGPNFTIQNKGLNTLGERNVWIAITNQE